MPSETSTMQSAARTFFSCPHFAVAGASSNPSKFGNTIFAWYTSHNLPVTPVNPGNASIRVQRKDYQTVASPLRLSDPAKTSLSIVTPPMATREVLREAKQAGVRAVWLQPGSFGDAEFEYAMKEFPGAAVGGMGQGTRGGEGWCVLVDGEKAMREAEREGKL